MSEEASITPAETEDTSAAVEQELEGAAAEDTGDSGSDAGAPAEDTGDSGKSTEESADDEAGEGDQTSPDSYSDFTLPEGIELDEAVMEKALPLFKEMKLTQDQAQKLVDFQAEMVQEGARRQADAFSQLIGDWQNQAENDKEFGGDKFSENVATAQKAIAQFGTPELKELMESHGVGNHPEMIRFMWKVGQTLKEDVPGDDNSSPTSQTKDRVSILYPEE